MNLPMGLGAVGLALLAGCASQPAPPEADRERLTVQEASRLTWPPVTAELRARLRGTDTVTCSSRFERCLVPIYVLPKVKPDFSPGCEVYITVQKIIVERRDPGLPKTKIVWLLTKGDLSDTSSRYGFTNSAGQPGIEFSTSFSPSDFDGGDHDADDETGDTSKKVRRFKWRSVNSHASGDKEFDYLPNVYRRTQPGSTPITCDRADPVIINKGP
jgi:hypothetical protein